MSAICNAFRDTLHAIVLVKQLTFQIKRSGDCTSDGTHNFRLVKLHTVLYCTIRYTTSCTLYVPANPTINSRFLQHQTGRSALLCKTKMQQLVVTLKRSFTGRWVTSL